MKMFHAANRGELVSFVGVGMVGLLIDTAVFLLLLNYADWNVPWARTLSVSCSITTTWALNRRYTFTGSIGSLHWEYARYTAAQILGLTINLGVFTLCLSMSKWAHRHPLAALIAGAAAASFFNFLAARSFAYIRVTKKS